MKFIDLKLATEKELLTLNSDERIAAYRINGGPAFCGYYAGRLVGAAGLHIIRDGYALAWALIDRGFEKLPKGLPTAENIEYLEMVMWTFKEMLDILQKRFGIRKMRASSKKGFSASQRFLKACGFRKLCEGRKYFIYEYGA